MRSLKITPIASISYNLGLRIFSEKPSSSNDGSYCSLHSCRKLGKSLELFWRKGQKPSHGRTDRRTDRTDRPTDRCQFIGPTSKVGWSKNKKNNKKENERLNIIIYYGYAKSKALVMKQISFLVTTNKYYT